MPSVNDLSNSKYVTKEEAGKGILVTISGFKKVDVSRESEKEDLQFILLFHECKPLVLKKTNGNKIAEIMHEVYGVTRDNEDDGEGNMIPANENFEYWIGKKIVLWNNPDVEFRGKITGGVRVRAPKGQPTEEQQARTQINAPPLDNEEPRPTDDQVPF